MSTRVRNVIAAAAAVLSLALAASAFADDFCVGSPAGCTGTPVPGPLFGLALQQSQTNGTDDRFFLAPGTFATANLVYESTELVKIIGAGADQTTLTGNSDATVLELGGNDASSISGLTIKPTDLATSGLTLEGTSAHDVKVDATNAPAAQAGVILQSDATFDGGSVVVGSAVQYGVVALSGSPSVSDSRISAPDTVAFVAAGTDGAVRRSTLDAKWGALVIAGHMSVADTFIDLRGHSNGAPALGIGTQPPVGTSVRADVERLTVVGSTPASTTDTVAFYAYASGAGSSATVNVRDSVATGLGVPLARVGDTGGTANITISRSVYPSALQTYDIGTGSLTEQDRLKVSPGFVGNGSFHLAADSALIDAGSPAGLTDDATDRDGLPRESDGNGDCTHVSDIGAFEFQGTQVKAVAAAAATAASVGDPVGFSADGSCIPGPGAPTVTWSFDDGTDATGANVTHAFATAGHHVATVTVSDHGNSAQASAAVDIMSPSPAATATPSVASAPTAPRLARLRITPARVRIGSLLPKLVRATAKRPLGTISFQLSKPATVTLQFAKLSRHGKPRVLKAKITVKARKGLNRIRFAGRVTKAVALRPGKYRMTAIATDSGARSKPATARFAAVGRR